MRSLRPSVILPLLFALSVLPLPLRAQGGPGIPIGIPLSKGIWQLTGTDPNLPRMTSSRSDRSSAGLNS